MTPRHRALFCFCTFWLTILCESGVAAKGNTANSEFSLSQSKGRTRHQAAVRRALEEQVNAWNRGDIEGFMAGYWKSDSLVFTSGGKITRGWTITLERYKKLYPTRELMGTLSFGSLEISVLDQTTAWVLGKWKLQRDKDSPHGIFTLVLRRFPEGWKIIHDHTSSEP